MFSTGTFVVKGKCGTTQRQIEYIMLRMTHLHYLNWLYPTYRNNLYGRRLLHYDDVIMSAIASQITSLAIVYSTVYLGADQRKHESSASLAFVRGIHRGPVNSPQKWPVTRKMFPFDDVIMYNHRHNTWCIDETICRGRSNFQHQLKRIFIIPYRHHFTLLISWGYPSKDK